jgi:diketogulonate reductase-like aldo/keto reductase
MSYKLSSGHSVPLVGLGTYKNKEPTDLDVLKVAIVDHGYRHIDTASHYENEQKIGEKLEEIYQTSKVTRGDLFITTKLWTNEKTDPVGALKQSLKRLRTTYVDLYLIHFPVATKEADDKSKMTFMMLPNHVVWTAMEECVKQGLARSIGVSNFNYQLLADLLTYAQIRPVANQIELHPYLAQEQLVDWMKKEAILPIAYCPIGRPSETKDGEQKEIDDLVIREIADKHKCAPIQIVLAWGLARGHAIVPKTTHSYRALENWKSQEVKLSEEEVQRITALNRNERIVDPIKKKLFNGSPIFS